MLQTNVPGVCGEHSQCSGHTGFGPARGVCAFPVYTAQAPGCSIGSGPRVVCGSSFRVFHKSADTVWPAFCAFPDWSSSGIREPDKRTLPRCGAPYPLRSPSLSFCTRLVCVLVSWSLTATLSEDVNHPESQEVFA